MKASIPEEKGESDTMSTSLSSLLLSPPATNEHFGGKT